MSYSPGSLRASRLLALALAGALACAGQPAADGGNGSGGSGIGSGGSGNSSSGGSGAGGGSSGGSGGSGQSMGGSGQSQGGSGGSGMAGAGGAGPASQFCGGYQLPTGNRCKVAPVVKAMGGAPMIDDMEPGPDDTPTCHKIKAADGRSGGWNYGKDEKSPEGSVVQSWVEPGEGGAPGSTRALQIVGKGLNDWGGYLTVEIASCYDASAYQGLSFWLKGDPTRTPYLKVMIITPYTAPAGAEGGECMPGPLDGQSCYDHATVQEFKLSPTWTRYAISWQQLSQIGWGQKIPNDVKPETQIIGINFAPVFENDALMNKSFEFYLDDLSFDVSGPFSDTGLGKIVSKSQFDQMFSSQRGGAAVASLYANAYDDLLEALNDPRFSRIAREGTEDERKREVAAFMAHIVQESGALAHARELNPPMNYCQANNTLYPCAPGQQYWGRGPMQLSWNYNYGPASEFLGLGTSLLTNPDQVAMNGPLAWKTALYFWMGWKDKVKNEVIDGSHSLLLKKGFGATIRAINGAQECAPGEPRAQKRREVFRQFCQTIGVGGCDANLECPPEAP